MFAICTTILLLDELGIGETNLTATVLIGFAIFSDTERISAL